MKKLLLLSLTLFCALSSCKDRKTPAPLQSTSDKIKPANTLISSTLCQHMIPDQGIAVDEQRQLAVFPANLSAVTVKLNWQTSCYFLAASIELKINIQNGVVSVLSFSDSEGRTANDAVFLTQYELQTPYLSSIKIAYNQSTRTLKATGFVNGCNRSGANLHLNGCWSPARDGGLGILPVSGTKDGYYIVSKPSGRAITKVTDGVQIQQTETASDDIEPSTAADIAISWFGTMSNPANFSPGTYAIYKIQWGRFSPYTLSNRFWDAASASSDQYTPVITAQSTNNNSQRYIFLPTGDSDGSIYIVSLATGKYLQIAGNAQVGTQSGAKLETASYSGDSNQKFLIWKRSGF